MERIINALFGVFLAGLGIAMIQVPALMFSQSGDPLLEIVVTSVVFVPVGAMAFVIGAKIVWGQIRG